MNKLSESLFQLNAFKLKALALIVILLSLIAFGFSKNQAQTLLEVDEAFEIVDPSVKNQTLTFHWNIAKDYYLYQDKMSVTATTIILGSPQYSNTEPVEDPLFGNTEVFKNNATITIPYSGQAKQTEITVKYQGCAAIVGVCYPPQTRTFALNLPNVHLSNSKNVEPAFDSLSSLNDFFSQESQQPELLEADDAFQFSYSLENNQLNLNWLIAQDYHLYQDKIKARVINGNAELENIKLPQATIIDDKVFGKTAVYHGELNAKLDIINPTDNTIIEIEYQGCSAASGVCYPPIKQQISLALEPNTTGNNSAPITAEMEANPTLSEADQITDTLKNQSVWIVIFTFFIFGLLLAFTPCVFPMIPILSSIIAGQGDNLTTRKAFTMSLVYVLAMSLTYTVAGVLAGLFGENLQALFQNPWIIASFSLIFVALAFSMFGFYELQLPSRLQSKLTSLSNQQKGGTLTGVAIMGLLSALIVGPCVAPPLAGALIYIGQTGDAFLGGIALFALSLGMGVPLLLLGTSAGKLLPKAGAWMDSVKAVFGVMLIGVAIWMLERIVPAEITMLNWALLLIISSVYMGAFRSTSGKSGWFKLLKGLAITLFIYGVMIFIGLLGGSQQVLQPLKVYQGGALATGQTTDKLNFKVIKSYQDLENELAKGHPIMLDFYADWCISCKEMEAFTFTKPQVHEALKGITLLKADVTANDEVDKALMKHFGIIGPPAILFFNETGQEQKAQRVIGFKNADEFTAFINKAFQ